LVQYTVYFHVIIDQVHNVVNGVSKVNHRQNEKGDWWTLIQVMCDH